MGDRSNIKISPTGKLYLNQIIEKDNGYGAASLPFDPDAGLTNYTAIPEILNEDSSLTNVSYNTSSKTLNVKELYEGTIDTINMPIVYVANANPSISSSTYIVVKNPNPFPCKCRATNTYSDFNIEGGGSSLKTVSAGSSLNAKFSFLGLDESNSLNDEVFTSRSESTSYVTVTPKLLAPTSGTITASGSSFTISVTNPNPITCNLIGANETDGESLIAKSAASNANATWTGTASGSGTTIYSHFRCSASGYGTSDNSTSVILYLIKLAKPTISFYTYGTIRAKNNSLAFPGSGYVKKYRNGTYVEEKSIGNQSNSVSTFTVSSTDIDQSITFVQRSTSTSGSQAIADSDVTTAVVPRELKEPVIDFMTDTLVRFYNPNDTAVTIEWTGSYDPNEYALYSSYTTTAPAGGYSTSQNLPGTTLYGGYYYVRARCKDTGSNYKYTTQYSYYTDWEPNDSYYSGGGGY